jgi:hypothetical protein
MLAQSAMPSGAAPDRFPLGWLILLPLGCLALGQVLLVWTNIIPVLDGILVDPDGYMRLNRVLWLHDSGAWFDSRFWRINPPEGHVQHWTRPLDAVLLLGAWMFEPLLGFRAGLHLWGILVSPVCLALTVVALAWAIAPVLDRDSRMFACLAFLMQPTIMAYSSVGRPDHHSLLLLLFVVLLGLTFRLLNDPFDHRSAKLAGATAALSLWISLESLTFVGCSLAVLGLYWLLGDGSLGHKNRSYLSSLTIYLGLALLIERGPQDLFAIENDRLSVLHVVPFLLITAFWALAVRVEQPDDRWHYRVARLAIYSRRPFARPEPPRPRWLGIVSRGVLAGCAVAGIGLAMVTLLPELRQGPLGQIDPLYNELRLQRIVEIQPLVSPERLAAGQFGQIANRVIQVIGIAFLAIPFLALLIIRPEATGHRVWVCIALSLAVFLPLAAYQLRWSSYTQVLLVLPYSAFVAWLLARITRRVPPTRLQFVRPMILVGALFWPVGVAQLLPQQEIVTANEACPIDRASPLLNQLGRSGTILALADYGPELLYRTEHRVLSIPNHRPQPGFGATYRALTASDEQAAWAEITAHDVDWILLCPSIVERSMFLDERATEDTLYRRLIDGTGPAWLRQVTLNDELHDQIRLYEVDPSRAGARSPSASPERF